MYCAAQAGLLLSFEHNLTDCKKLNKTGTYSSGLLSGLLTFFFYSFILRPFFPLPYSQLSAFLTLLNPTYLHGSYLPPSSSSPVASLYIRLDLELVFFQVSSIWRELDPLLATHLQFTSDLNWPPTDKLSLISKRKNLSIMACYFEGISVLQHSVLKTVFHT